MSPEQRVLAAEKRQRFFQLIRQTYPLQQYDLLRVIRARDKYSPKLRAAALRNLVATSPLHVTQGRCYAERRRLVKEHFEL